MLLVLAPALALAPLAAPAQLFKKNKQEEENPERKRPDSFPPGGAPTTPEGAPQPDSLAQLSTQQERGARYIEAANQLAQDNNLEAREILNELLEEYPQFAPAHYLLGQAHYKDDNLQDALPPAERALELDSANKWYYILVANIHQDQVNFWRSAEIVEQAMERFPDDHELEEHLARLYTLAGDYGKAYRLYADLQQKRGFSLELAMKQHRLLMMDDKLEEAIALLERVLEEAPHHPQVSRQLYQMHRKNRDQQAQLELLEYMLEGPETRGFALLKLVEHYREEGELDKADQFLNQAFESKELSLDQKVQYLLTLLPYTGDSSVQQQVDRLSRQVYNQNPESPTLNALRGDLFRLKAEFDSAQYYYQRALEYDASNQLIWQQLLNVDSEMNDLDALAEHSEEALVLFPNNQYFLYMNGLANYQLNNYETAVSRLRKFTRIGSPETEMEAHVLTLLGDSFNYLEQYNESDRYYTEALKLKPDNATALNNYAYFLSLRGEKLDTARVLIQRALELEPESASFQDTYGWILYLEGDYEKALKWILKAYAKQQSSEVCDHLGDIYSKLGKHQLAIQYWREAQEKGLDTPKLQNKIDRAKGRQ